MIFNFTDKFQFSTRFSLDGFPLEIVDSAKLLGTIIENKLTWNLNIKNLVKKAYQRMTMLHYLVEYEPSIEDLLTIYKLYIRSPLEQSAVVWNSGLTEENKSDLERVQKNLS